MCVGWCSSNPHMCVCVVYCRCLSIDDKEINAMIQFWLSAYNFCWFFFRTPLTNRAVLTVWLRNLSTNIAQQIAFVFYILIILDQHNHIHNRTSHIYILQHSVFVCVCVMSWTTWAATIAQNYQKRNELRKGNFNVIVKSHAKHHIFVFFFSLEQLLVMLIEQRKNKNRILESFWHGYVSLLTMNTSNFSAFTYDHYNVILWDMPSTKKKK